jgi:hypothetical protein
MMLAKKNEEAGDLLPIPFDRTPVAGTPLFCSLCYDCGVMVGCSSRPEVLTLVERIHARRWHSVEK